MSGFAPEEVPLYPDREAVEREYERAQREREPFFGVERYEERYAVTYDLLPAGAQLVEPAYEEARERLTAEVEAVVGDEAAPTAEVSQSISASLCSVSLFEREASARRVGAALSTVVLDRDNWEAAPPEGPDRRRN